MNWDSIVDAIPVVIAGAGFIMFFVMFIGGLISKDWWTGHN